MIPSIKPLFQYFDSNQTFMLKFHIKKLSGTKTLCLIAIKVLFNLVLSVCNVYPFFFNYSLSAVLQTDFDLILKMPRSIKARLKDTPKSVEDGSSIHDNLIQAEQR